MDYGRPMAENINVYRRSQIPQSVLSLAVAQPIRPVIQPLPTSLKFTADCDTASGYAIDLPDRNDANEDLRWNTVCDDHLIDGDIERPTTQLRVTAGFIYRCGAQIRPTPTPADLAQFASLCDSVAAACAGWSVGLLLQADEPGSGFGRGRSVYALNRSRFVDAKTTPPHLFELTFSYGGVNDEVRSQSAYGSDALTSPIAAVAWLVQQFGELRRCLEPGDTVFSGGLTSPVPVVGGGTYRALSSSLDIATDFGVGP